MSSTCHKIGLRRSSDLATINAAIAARLPEMAAGKIGLTEIADSASVIFTRAPHATATFAIKFCKSWWSGTWIATLWNSNRMTA